MGFENDIADARMGACHSARRWLARNFEADLHSFDTDRRSLQGEHGYQDWLAETAEGTISSTADALICLLGCSSDAEQVVDSEFGDEDHRTGSIIEWAILAYEHDLANHIERHRGDEPWPPDDEDDEEEEGDD